MRILFSDTNRTIASIKEVTSHTFKVFLQTRAFNRAAGLSFNTMLGLGPVVALAVLTIGLIFSRHDQHVAVTALNQVIHFIAPQLTEYEKISAADHSVHAGASVTFNPKLISMIDGFVASTQKSSAGVIETISLILVVLLLINSIEEAFNDIWHIQEKRPWLKRLGFFLTIMTLGSVLFVATVTLSGTSAFISVFLGHNKHFGPLLAFLSKGIFSIISFVLLVGILALFYRILPYTKVLWRSALCGASVASSLLILNNYLGFLYVRRVIDTRSLFGSLGIIPVLMFGMFIFWLMVLIGGQISYAIQKVYFKAKNSSL